MHVARAIASRCEYIAPSMQRKPRATTVALAIGSLLSGACTRAHPPRATSTAHAQRTESAVSGDSAPLDSGASESAAPDAIPLDASLLPDGDTTDSEALASNPSALADGEALASNSDPAPAACASDGDCVLVTGGCAGPMAAHRTQADTIDARHQRMRSSAYCGSAPMARPVRAVCTQSRCVIEPMDHPEWRQCERTRECVAIRRRCSHWQSINRRFEREARDADRPCTESGTPEPPPRIECQYGWCVAGWGGR